MSNLTISNNSTLSGNFQPVKSTKITDSVESAKTAAPAQASDKVELSDKKLSAKSIGAIAGSSLLIGGATASLGALLIKSSSSSTGAAAIFGGMAGALLIGTGAVSVIGGGIGGTLGAAVAETQAGGFGLGAAAGALVVGGAAFALSRDFKLSAMLAAPGAVAGGVGGLLGVKFAK